jgi:hypothetical protein
MKGVFLITHGVAYISLQFYELLSPPMPCTAQP